MMNFRKIAAASKGRLLLRYFTEDTPEPIHPPGVYAGGRQLNDGGRLTTYYTGRDSRATWRSDMPAAIAKAAGIDPHHMPRDAALSRLFEGRRADTGEAWSPSTRACRAASILFSHRTSRSLWPPNSLRRRRRAPPCGTPSTAPMTRRYATSHKFWVGYEKAPGGEDGVDPGAVGWVSFRHHTARPTLPIQDSIGGATYLADAPVAGDPHAHMHNFLLNLVATDDGRIGSLDTRALTDSRVKELGAYFQAVLADELRRVGSRVSYDASEQAVVLDMIPEEESKAFSKGRQQILGKAKTYAEDQGLDWDHLPAEEKLDILRDAGAAGRLGKRKIDERDLWREQARELGWQHSTAINEVRHKTFTDAERLDSAYALVAKHLAQEFHTAAVISHKKLGMYAARGLIGTGIAGGQDDVKRVVELVEQRGVRFREESIRIPGVLCCDRLSHLR